MFVLVSRYLITNALTYMFRVAKYVYMTGLPLTGIVLYPYRILVYVLVLLPLLINTLVYMFQWAKYVHVTSLEVTNNMMYTHAAGTCAAHRAPQQSPLLYSVPTPKVCPFGNIPQANRPVYLL